MVKIKLKALLIKRFNIAFGNKKMQASYKHDVQQIRQFIEELKQKRWIPNSDLVAEEKNFNNWFQDKKGFLPAADCLPIYSFKQLYLKNKTKLSEVVFYIMYTFIENRLTSEDINLIVVSAIRDLDEHQEAIGFPTQYELQIKNYWNQHHCLVELDLKELYVEDQFEQFVKYIDEALLFIGTLKYVHPHERSYFKEFYLKGMS